MRKFLKIGAILLIVVETIAAILVENALPLLLLVFFQVVIFIAIEEGDEDL